MLNNRNNGFLFVSLFIVLSDIIFIFINYQVSLNTLNQDIQDWANQTRNMFEVAIDAKATSMQQLATYVANDPRIGLLFKKGKQAVQREGGGSGKEKAAIIRNELLSTVSSSWGIMRERYDVRQLHFHLGPGSTSFLRVHRPEKYGDNMDDVRYTVVDANEKLLPTKGFETGRVYSGIRGVVPVLIQDREQRKKEHVGALEAGTSFKVLLESLRNELNSEFCILLSDAHVERNMWSGFVKTHFTSDYRHGDFFIESSTSNTVKKILSIQSLNSRIDRPGAFFIKRPFPLQVCIFSLRDYKATVDQHLSPVGNVVVWKDATKRWNAFKKSLINNILYAIIALFVIETVLYFVWNLSRKKLKSIIELQTKEINKNYNRLENIINSLPTGILEVDQESGKIVEANPQALEMLGSEKRNVIGRQQNDFIQEPYQGNGEAPSDYHLISADGDEIPVLKMEISVKIHDRNVLIISFADLTKNKEAEFERLHKEKLQGVLEMCGAICHELNQPLMSISGYSELLLMDIPKDKSHYSKVTIIKEQIDRLGEITKKLMKINKYRTKSYLDRHIIDIDEASDGIAPDV